MRLLLVFCLGVAAVLASQPAEAWGPQGHQAVGAIADQLIAGTPTATKVRKILGSTLKNAAGWADCARSVERVKGIWTYTQPGVWKDCAVYETPTNQKPLIDFVQRNASRCDHFAGSEQCRHKAYHFVDLPLRHPQYDPSLPGTAPNDLVQAIRATLVVLQGGKSPPPFDIRGQKEALRLLTHYVGDLHQPLHVGAIYLDDTGEPLDPATPQEAHAHASAGGNKIVIQGRKLHQLWDDVPDKLFKQLTTASGAAEARQVGRSPGDPLAWPAVWAGESTTEAAKVFTGLKIDAKVTHGSDVEWPASAEEPGYRQAREALQRQQLVRAGARLAQLLTTLLP